MLCPFTTHFLSKRSENIPSNKGNDDDDDETDIILLHLLFPGYL